MSLDERPSRLRRAPGREPWAVAGQVGAIRVLTWNLFHGRAKPAAGRPLLVEFAAAIGGWRWDVALLQEVPPWWPPLLARAAGAPEHRTVLTSRNEGLALRRAIARRNPDLIASNGGGANAILSRVPLAPGQRRVRLAWRPERRVAHGVRLLDGTTVVNLHASTHPPERRRADLETARRHALAWAGGGPLVLGGDLNAKRPCLDGLELAASHRVDHVLVAGGLTPGGPAERLDAGTLSDHAPLAVDLRAPGAV
jgi:endonuclease/exonuclease/phosphatase family metal-dependent hydrolase